MDYRKWESREELLSLARSSGFDLSEPQLARWHRAGLLPRPTQRPLGRGHGTQTVYPPGTEGQLLALCGVHAEVRSLDRVAWHLWWAGYDVSIDCIREFLSSVVAEWDEKAQGLIDQDT